MCELLNQNPKGGMAIPSPSLGLIKPTKVTVTVADGEPWDTAAQAKIDKASAPDLFGTSLKPLQPAPFAIKYHYHCESAGCGGHHQKVLDWEAGEGGREWLRDYGEAGARDAMLKKWRDEMLSTDNDVHLFVGNQNAPPSVLLSPRCLAAEVRERPVLDVHHGGVRAGLQQLAHHDVAVALGVVVLEAEKRHYAAVQELADVGQRVGGGRAVEHLAILGVGLGFAGAEPCPVVLGIAQRGMVHVADADGGEGLGQLRLRQTGLAAQRVRRTSTRTRTSCSSSCPTRSPTVLPS